MLWTLKMITGRRHMKPLALPQALPSLLTVACARIPLNACLLGNTWASLKKEYKKPSLYPTGMAEGVTPL